MSKLIDLTGRKFGRLTVLGRSGTYQRPSGNKEPTWLCKCECGNEVVVMSSNLKKKGNTLSCGCLQTENRFGARRETECEIRGDVVCAKTFEGAEFIVSVCDLDTVKLHRWRINASGYVADEHGRTIHRTLMSPPSVMDVHHINGDKLDNRRSNLLMMTRYEHTSLHQKQNIANGVVISNSETATDKDTNVPSKVVPHKVDTDHVLVGSGIWRRGTTVYKCPKCQTFVMRYCKYCFECGQALEWQTEPPKGE